MVLFRKERAELQRQVQDVIGAEERQRVEKESRADRYREKAQQYKQKLRLALQNVQTLAQRIARYELIGVAERDEDGGAPGGGRAGSRGDNDIGSMREDELHAEI